MSLPPTKTGKHFVRTSKQITTCSTITLSSTRSVCLNSPPSTLSASQNALIEMAQLLSRKRTNRLRYSMQVLKQFILFDESVLSSSLVSVDRYDPILFSDQQLHSLTKIMETQLSRNKLWAFINLKTHNKKAQLKQLETAVSKAMNEGKLWLKKQSFEMIVWRAERNSNKLGVFRTEEVRVQPPRKEKRMDSYNMVSIAVVNPSQIKPKIEQNQQQIYQSRQIQTQRQNHQTLESHYQQIQKRLDANKQWLDVEKQSKYAQITSQKYTQEASKKHAETIAYKNSQILSQKNASMISHKTRGHSQLSGVGGSYSQVGHGYNQMIGSSGIQKGYCSGCYHCSYCCADYNLWDRIQYLKHLQQMAAGLERSS